MYEIQARERRTQFILLIVCIYSALTNKLTLQKRPRNN